MTAALDPCEMCDHPGTPRRATHTVGARYWWGDGPNLRACDGCTDRFAGRVRARARATGFTIRFYVDGHELRTYVGSRTRVGRTSRENGSTQPRNTISPGIRSGSGS